MKTIIFFFFLQIKLKKKTYLLSVIFTIRQQSRNMEHYLVALVDSVDGIFAGHITFKTFRNEYTYIIDSFMFQPYMIIYFNRVK